MSDEKKKIKFASKFEEQWSRETTNMWGVHQDDNKKEAAGNKNFSAKQQSYLHKASQFFAAVIFGEALKAEENEGFTKNPDGAAAVRAMLNSGMDPEHMSLCVLATVMRFVFNDKAANTRALIDDKIMETLLEQLDQDCAMIRFWNHLENEAKNELDKDEKKRKKQAVKDTLKRLEARGSFGKKTLNNLAKKLGDLNKDPFNAFTKNEQIQVGDYFLELIKKHMCGTEEVSWSITEIEDVADYDDDDEPQAAVDISKEGFPLFSWESSREGVILTLNPLSISQIDFLEAAQLAQSFSARPMIIPPLSFVESKKKNDGPVLGGWITRQIQPIASSKFNNHSGKTVADSDQDVDDRILEYLDRIGSTAYCVNVDVLKAADWVLNQNLMWSKGDGGFTKTKKMTVPELPEKLQSDKADWKTKEAKDYLAKLSEVRQHNAKINGKMLASRAAMSQAVRDMNEKELYFPASLDFRGRVYFRTDFLSPQGDTFSKGVLQFAKGSKVNMDVLRRFIASFVTDSGDLSDTDMSKASKQAQIDWTLKNEDTLRKIAADYEKTVDLWSKTDSPFEFLGAVQDYVRALDADGDYESKIIIRIDAVASGIQHLASISRDESVADAVCLRGQERSTDLYTLVAEGVNKKLELYAEDLQAWKTALDAKAQKTKTGEVKKPSKLRNLPVDEWSKLILELGGHKRGDTKPVSMQYTYAVTEGTIAERLLDDRGWRQKLRTKIDDQRTEIDDQETEIDDQKMIRQIGQVMARIQFQVIEEISKELVSVMKWYQDCAKVLRDRGWVYTNPAGFKFRQFYFGTKTQNLPTPNAVVKILKSNEEVDLLKMGTAISANQTHSLDGALLVLTTQRFDGSMSVIHDSIGCLSSELNELEKAVREAHLELYKRPLLADMKKQNEDRTGRELPELPETGGLNVEDVLTASYYFC